LLLAKIDKQQQVETLEQQLKEQNLVFASLQRSFAEKIATQGFENIAAFTQLRSLVNNVASLQSQYRQNKELYDQLSLQQLRCNGLLKEELQDFDDSISEQDLLDLQRLLAEKIEIAEHEVRNLLNKLDKQQKYRRKHQSLEVELDEYRRQLALVAAESLSLQAEPAEVKAKVKELLITQLLNQANQILEKISGRYYLRSVPSEHGLALEIEDSKQGNVRRLPKTLSGGESFIVSLALSLALADIANNGKTIESLFLDEGFGNLDAEALYMAMSALEVLKFQGRTVGIISHVEAVKKRIKTQIELVKKANGLSELKLVA
jgi:exonuclease SbcC